MVQADDPELTAEHLADGRARLPGGRARQAQVPGRFVGVGVRRVQAGKALATRERHAVGGEVLGIGGGQRAAAGDHDRGRRRAGQREHQRQRHQDRAAGPRTRRPRRWTEAAELQPELLEHLWPALAHSPSPPAGESSSVPPSARSPRETRARAATSEIPRSSATSA